MISTFSSQSRIANLAMFPELQFNIKMDLYPKVIPRRAMQNPLLYSCRMELKNLFMTFLSFSFVRAPQIKLFWKLVSWISVHSLRIMRHFLSSRMTEPLFLYLLLSGSKVQNFKSKSTMFLQMFSEMEESKNKGGRGEDLQYLFGFTFWLLILTSDICDSKSILEILLVHCIVPLDRNYFIFCT